jgi:hypothetical protein
MAHRIATLPRRTWEDLVEETEPLLTDALRCPGSDAQLRPIQAVSLREALECGGLFCMGAVGVGKTLISLLVGELMQEERVLILVPNGDKAKTEAEFDQYRKDWRGIPGERYRLLGYSDVSRFPKDGYSIDRLFGGLGPTMIVCDEADKLRRVDVSSGASGLALQINDYLVAHPDTKLIALTATPDKTGVKDYAHVLQWCLREGSPLPDDPQDLKDWSDVIDRGDAHAAGKVCHQLGIPVTPDIEAIRAAYHDRLRSTPGVVISRDGFDGPLEFECHLLEAPSAMVPHFHKLRKLWQRPDGWDLSPDEPDEEEERRPDRVTNGSVWANARQMALGFCYIADPVPPADWLDCRKLYFRSVRACLQARLFYTEHQFRQAAAKRELPRRHQRAYDDWEKMRPSFEPGSRALWLSDHALEWCIDWGSEAPGIIFVDHIAFGLELEKRTGWLYYQAGGKNRYGKRVDALYRKGQHARETVICARGACGTGKNLQAWNRMLFTAMPANNRDFEQAVGREHRSGQDRPVKVDILVACKEHFESLAKVLDDAERQSQTLMRQKAATFPWVFPPELPKGIIFNDHED